VFTKRAALGSPSLFYGRFYRIYKRGRSSANQPYTTALEARVREALGSSSNILRALVRTPSRLTHNTTNGILLASTPMPRVTVAFPSTVVMAGSKFPPSL
jgi:hypothetical protein